MQKETMEFSSFKKLALALDALPNGFPPTKDGAELRLLEKLFSAGEAELASQLSTRYESAEEIAARIGGDAGELRRQLKGMSRRGLIDASRTESGLGYRLLPFVVGIYEMQVGNLNAELAQLFEDYFKDAFTQVHKTGPQFHRVIPIGESVRSEMEIHPFESASDLVNSAQAWGVLDCICRKQKALIGEACEHPLDVCMALNDHPGVFDNSTIVRALTREEALATLKRAADAGLVHSVSNTRDGVHYICNCCTCSCGILRSIADLGIANVIARSAFINRVDETLCNTCAACVETCQFDALSLGTSLEINEVRCVGCGVCVPVCPSEALGLVRRPESEILPIPETIDDWGERRRIARNF
jgi:NAD-dependent dihydropyrimidine dehydrogenase PreA subunit